jgi:hypothetical protein
MLVMVRKVELVAEEPELLDDDPVPLDPVLLVPVLPVPVPEPVLPEPVLLVPVPEPVLLEPVEEVEDDVLVEEPVEVEPVTDSPTVPLRAVTVPATGAVSVVSVTAF